MSIRAAILAAATHIDQHPGDYCFLSSARPSPCQTAGCALGWIGYYAHIPSSAHGYLQRVEKFMGLKTSEFYARMENYAATGEKWTASPRSCAHALRMYAEEFHPE